MPVLPKIRGSSFISSSRIISVCQIFFLNHPEFVRSCLSVSFHRSLSFQKNSSSSHFSYRYPIIPVLRSSVLLSARCLFVLLHLNPLKQICSSNSSRWFSPFLRSFSILTVVRSRFLLLCYHINSSVVYKSHQWFHQYFLKFTLYLS